ncbi:MAG: hypothetical protein WBY71_08680, partial [Nitrososphaeraceae archaeon]
ELFRFLKPHSLSHKAFTAFTPSTNKNRLIIEKICTIYFKLRFANCKAEVDLPLMLMDLFNKIFIPKR